MPLTSKGSKIKSAMQAEYGADKGTRVFYASRNAGRITGVDPESSGPPRSGFGAVKRKDQHGRHSRK